LEDLKYGAGKISAPPWKHAGPYPTLEPEKFFENAGERRKRQRGQGQALFAVVAGFSGKARILRFMIGKYIESCGNLEMPLRTYKKVECFRLNIKI
jgi:hypothetical protein